MDTFIRSVEYALIVAIVGSMIGILLSYYIERRKIKFGGVLDFIITLPYMLPGSCFGIGYILAFNHEPLKLTGTAVIVILNMIYKQMSITTKASASSLLQISTELDAAARDLGANKFLVMKDVILPNVKQAFATGFINNFTSAMVTAGAVIFLVTPGQKIAVFTLFDCINTGRYGEASMIATFIIVITIINVAIIDASPYRPVLMQSNNVNTAIFCPGVTRKITAPAVTIALVKLLINPVANACFTFGRMTSFITRNLFAPRSRAAASSSVLICKREDAEAFVVIDICL